MRHGNRLARLGRPADQRKALIRGLVTEVLRHGKIETTKVRVLGPAVQDMRAAGRAGGRSTAWQGRQLSEAAPFLQHVAAGSGCNQHATTSTARRQDNLSVTPLCVPPCPADARQGHPQVCGQDDWAGQGRQPARAAAGAGLHLRPGAGQEPV